MRAEVEAAMQAEKSREADRGARPETIQEGGSRGGYKSRGKQFSREADKRVRPETI